MKENMLVLDLLLKKQLITRKDIMDRIPEAEGSENSIPRHIIK